MDHLNKLIRFIYSPPRYSTNWSLEGLAPNKEIRYFSYGRYALLSGLAAIGIKKGDSILVPAFICRDLLASIHSIGAQPVFYPVNRKLQLAVPPTDLPSAKAVLAVNFFGFPQDLAPFEEYCSNSGAILIEDNAHGLFSQDEMGRFLGTRGDIGIFSLRKTISLPDGAALLLNRSDDNWTLAPQLPFSKAPPSKGFLIKKGLRRLVPFMGISLPRMLTTLGRLVRKLRTGHEIAPSPPDAERCLPGSAIPCQGLPGILAQVDPDREIQRRRETYQAVGAIILEGGGEPVFDDLPPGTAPYVFPFRATESALKRIKSLLADVGLECHPWPDLPDAVAPTAPEHYKVWMVGFLW